MEHSTKNKKGFTLIEIMVAIAIVGILAAVVLVSLSSFGAKGRSAKALAQLSSAIPSMISCAGNKGWDSVNDASSNGNICGSDSNYGKWPQTTGDLGGYAYQSSIIDSSDWAIYLYKDSDNVRICCNSAMNSCKKMDDNNCTAGYPSY